MIDRDRYFRVLTITITKGEPDAKPEPRSPSLWPVAASLAVLGLSVIAVVLAARVFGLIVGW